jgi:hypothetical protein
MNAFEHSDDIAKQIMDLPFISSLPEAQQDSLQRKLARFRTQVLNDVQVNHDRSFSILKSKSENYIQ